MSYDYIHTYYGVPAGDGVRVVYRDPDGDRPGTIVGTVNNSRLLIQLDGEPTPDVFHPTWGIEYPDGVQ